MADGKGGGGGGEGGRSSESIPMDKLVEAMLINGQALAEAVAADRARREAADRIQRESWEAALKEKDAVIDVLREEASDVKKKLQADASRKTRWDAAYELFLGANQKLAELRDADLGDSRTCAETPNSKTALLKSKKVEPAQATEAAIKLQQSVDELKVLAQKKDDEIARLQAEAVGAKRELQKMYSLVKEKDDEIQRLKGWHPVSVQKPIKDINGTHKKFRSGEPALTVKDKLENTNLGHKPSGSDEESINSPVQKQPGNPKRKRDACSADCPDCLWEKNYREKNWKIKDGESLKLV